MGVVSPALGPAGTAGSPRLVEKRGKRRTHLLLAEEAREELGDRETHGWLKEVEEGGEGTVWEVEVAGQATAAMRESPRPASARASPPFFPRRGRATEGTRARAAAGHTTDRLTAHATLSLDDSQGRG